MQALGLIEVIGYPPAVEAADAALKAANVTLLSIAKADAGIMTVEVIGDVGAVTSAVDAGASSAARIGIVRARHVIPRVETDLIGKVIPQAMNTRAKETDNTKEPITSSLTLSANDNEVKIDTSFGDKDLPKLDSLETNSITEKITKSDDENNKVDKEVEQEDSQDKNQEVKKVENLDENNKTFTVEQLNKRSNANLRSLIKSKGITTDKQLSEMKKQELIRLILDNQ